MPVIKVEDIAHVRFAAPDLATMRAFLEDFGLNPFEQGGRLYGRGSDGRPFVHVTEPREAKFLALGLRAETVEDLALLAAHEGVLVEDFDEPGGGKVVRLVDPDGYRIEVVAGQVSLPAASLPADLPTNTAMTKRRLGTTVRLEPAPARVRRMSSLLLESISGSTSTVKSGNSG